MNNRKKLLEDQRVLLTFVIVVVIAVVSMINPKFIMVRSLITIFQQISVTGILTMAMSMLPINGGTDLLVRNIIVLSGAVMAQVINTGRNTPPAVVVGIGVAVACGVLNGFVIAKSKCIPLITTLGTSQVFYGLTLTISGGKTMGFGGVFNAIGRTKLSGVFSVMLFVLATMVMLSYLLMNKTKLERRIVVTGSNEKNAFLFGINVIRYEIIIYIIVGFSCAIVAVIFSARIDPITASVGAEYETSILTAVIIGGITFDGGKGTALGVFLGCVLMGVINNAMNIFQVETYTQIIIIGVIIVCTVMLSNINNIKKRQEAGQW